MRHRAVRLNTRERFHEGDELIADIANLCFGYVVAVKQWYIIDLIVKPAGARESL
jgi:hypothetical protein